MIEAREAIRLKRFQRMGSVCLRGLGRAAARGVIVPVSRDVRELIA